jgi:hypothetical protein
LIRRQSRGAEARFQKLYTASVSESHPRVRRPPARGREHLFDSGLWRTPQHERHRHPGGTRTGAPDPLARKESLHRGPPPPVVPERPLTRCAGPDLSRLHVGSGHGP